MKNIGENPAMSGVLRKMLFWCISFQILGITANFLRNMCSQMKSSKQGTNLIQSLIEKQIIKKFSFCQECYADIFFCQILPIYEDYSFIGLEIITERLSHIMQQIWEF